MNPRDVAERYFACIRAGDLDGLIGLYAEDATFMMPNGKQFSGLAAIREMHAGVFAAASPFPSPLAMIVVEHSIAVEIEARLPDGTVRRTANFFHLTSDGKIRRLSVYMQIG